MHDDEETIIEALKQVDVVICSVASKQVHDQKTLISAIKRAGCIKVNFFSFRLLPIFSLIFAVL